MHEPILFGHPVHLLLLYFLIYSFLGWCLETVYCSILERRLVPRGFLLGPVCPIYGVGALMMICWFSPFMGNPMLFYLVATACMSAWEYLVGWFLEATTHIKYWDYSRFKFNLKGRICLWVCLVWGVLAYIILFWVHPLISELVLRASLSVRYMITTALSALLIADTVTTIRKLALTVKLVRALDEARVQLALGRAELEDKLQEARDDLSEKLTTVKTRHAENAARLQTTYNELLAKAAYHSRRFLNRYRTSSSNRYHIGLSDLKERAGQLRQRLAEAKATRKK